MRFPEFSGEWEKHYIRDIATIEKGNGISKDLLSEDGEPCILYGELYTKYKSEIISEVISKTNINAKKLVRSKANDVIIPCSGETAVDIATARCVPFDNILLGGDLSILRFDSFDGAFISYQLNGKRKYDIAKVAQGVSVVHLYPEHLKGIKVYAPSIDEQKKIVRFLSKLDERIETQIGLIEDLKRLKSAIYQYVFKGLNGDKVSLGSVCLIVKGQQVNCEKLNETGRYYVMNGGIEPSGYYDRCNVEANTISISEGGNSCGYVQYNDVPFWSGGHCYTLQQLSPIMNDRYLYHYLKSKQNKIMKLRIGTGLPNIQKKDFARMEIILPPLEEQKKIAERLSAIEQKITVETEIKELYARQRQFLLSQMFV